MARIVVDKKWWQDHRRLALIKILNSETQADGLALALWKLGFDFWIQDRSKVPHAIFILQPHHQILLDLKLAQLQDDQVYVKGSIERFEWYFKRSNAGKLGIVARRLADKKLLKLDCLSEEKINSNQPNLSKESKLHALADLWNDVMPPPFPKVLKTEGQRLKMATVRWKENPEKLYWASILEIIIQSDFLKGLNDRSWVADFDFLIKPGNAVKILEGKYSRKTQSHLQSVSDFNHSQRQKWLFNYNNESTQETQFYDQGGTE